MVTGEEDCVDRVFQSALEGLGCGTTIAYAQPGVILSPPAADRRSDESLCHGHCHTQNHKEFLRFAQNDSKPGLRPQRGSLLYRHTTTDCHSERSEESLRYDRYYSAYVRVRGLPRSILSIRTGGTRLRNYSRLHHTQTTERFFASLRMTATQSWRP